MRADAERLGGRLRLLGWGNRGRPGGAACTVPAPVRSGAVDGLPHGTPPRWDEAQRTSNPDPGTVDQTSVSAAGTIDTFLVLLIGIGPKIALVPFVELTAELDQTTKRRVQRKMLTTAATVAVLLVVLGEVL